VASRELIWSQTDQTFMQLALDAAAKQAGLTGENPAVGCVIVKDGVILAVGATSTSGRPHAEANALEAAAQDCAGSTVYVTLEPCAHESSRGPNCASSLVLAGVARVVACLKDPDPRTSGAGFERLRAAGIKVEIGLLAGAGRAQIEGFIARLVDQSNPN
jgi:diaminohydroxyphosphoribosylaminopyrimidine deaminase / 5-amino-6-(5-phosphoribosylamino)uracil reductase